MATNENLIKIFQYALSQEYTGKAFFEQSLGRMAIGAAISAFKRLAEEEQKHIEFITRIIEDLKKDQPLDPQSLKEVVLEPTNYFDERAKSEFLEQCLQGSMVPDVTVFNTAWLIEKDLSEFYEKMAMQVQGKAKDALVMLSKWEKGHEKFFREYRDKISEIYANMPWGG